MSLGDDPPELARRIAERPAWMVLGAWLLGSMVLGLIGPFGTFEILSLHHSLVFWFGVTALALGVLAPLVLLTQAIFGRDRHRFFYDAVQTPVFVLIYVWPLGELVEWYADGVPVFDHVTLGLVSFLTTLILIALREMVLALRRSNTVTAPRPATVAAETGPCPIADRLPESADREIWSVSGQNHHIVVRGPTTQSTVLLRFSDALRALDGQDGIQVHRSHWVADAAVAEWMRDGHRLAVALHDGHIIPVSRTFAESVQARWPERGLTEAAE